MLDFFKPITQSLIRNNPVIFNNIELKYTELFPSAADSFALIINYDAETEKYYVVFGREASIVSPSGKELFKKPTNGEVLIEGEENRKFPLSEPCYVDCSNVMMIDAFLFEDLIKIESKPWRKNKTLSEKNQRLILDKINECCESIPPYFSITEVTKNEYGTLLLKSKYMSDAKISEFAYEAEINNKTFNTEGLSSRHDELANPESKNRYNAAIEFITKFQKEHFEEQFNNTDYLVKYYRVIID